MFIIKMLLLIAEYIWLDRNNQYRSKTKIIKDNNANMDFTFNPINRKYPIWNYDGSSTGDIPENPDGNTECLLYPIFISSNPFAEDTHEIKYIFVLCVNSYILNGKEIYIHSSMGKYSKLKELLTKNEYMFGIEQEFFILDSKTMLPIGVDKLEDVKQGNYYCGNGIDNIKTREFINECQIKLLESGVSLSGSNYEVAPGQAEFQICDYGTKALWELIITRFIIIRCAEKFNYVISYENVLSASDNINNSGCHINISTKKMRASGGMKYIKEKIEELEKRVILDEDEFESVFGIGNIARLTGNLETSKWNEFTYGEGTRHTSIRIPNQVVKDGYGYFEDRRPGANVNPFNYVSYLLF